ncbi:MAG: hypothetical protein ACYCSO_06990 [Cuniculiplasma sp.]
MPNSESTQKSDILVVRKINKSIYSKFKMKAMEENRNVGDALNQAMADWLKKQEESEGQHIENMLKLKGLVKTKEVVRWSEEINETLYGESR